MRIRESGVTFVEALLVVVLVLFSIAVIGFTVFRGCFMSRESIRTNAIQALQAQGYDDARIQEYHRFFVGFRGCDAGDAVIVEASARNPRDRRVDVNVCIGWPFKGVTIRTE